MSFLYPVKFYVLCHVLIYIHRLFSVLISIGFHFDKNVSNKSTIHRQLNFYSRNKDKLKFSVSQMYCYQKLEIEFLIPNITFYSTLGLNSSQSVSVCSPESLSKHGSYILMCNI